MSDSRGQSERFLDDLVWAFFDDVKEDRVQMLEAAQQYCDDARLEARWSKFCDFVEAPTCIVEFLMSAGDIREILDRLIVRQEELDKEATEEYYEKQQAYRELQGC